MKHVQDNAEEQVRRVLGVLQDGAFANPLARPYTHIRKNGLNY